VNPRELLAPSTPLVCSSDAPCSPDVAAARIAAAFRAPAGALLRTPAIGAWRLVAVCEADLVAVTATPEGIDRARFIAWPLKGLVTTRLAFAGSVAEAPSGGSALAGRITPREPWWTRARFAVTPPGLFALGLAFGLGPGWALAISAAGTSIALAMLREEQRKAMRAAAPVADLLAQAVAGLLPPAPEPVASWGP
jgi:hypothetical protein